MPIPLYPLRFEPIFKTAIWGGDFLRPLLGAEPSAEPTGEAWLLSDQGDSPSRVAEGPLAGRTLRDLMETRPRELIGTAPTSNGRFPLLLKLLDSRQPLSVQVHPNDEQARRMAPASAGIGKTEAWVILKAASKSHLYAGLRAGIGRDEMLAALHGNFLPELLHSYVPHPGDCIFLDAGTIHAIGSGLVLFEVQQTSDITYRLYDWGRLDPKTGQPRELHIDRALECINFERGPCDPVRPLRTEDNPRERLVSCPFFNLERIRSDRPFSIGAAGEFRIVVCTEGRASLLYRDAAYPMTIGTTLLLPVAVGVAECAPLGVATILEIGPLASSRTL